MLRRVSCGLVGALLFAGIAFAPATAGAATAQAIKGAITCGVAGTMTFDKPLGVDPSAKSVKVKVKGNISTCSLSGPPAVTGGKAQITGGTFTITGTLAAGASCSDIGDSLPPDFTAQKNKIDIKWTNTVGKKSSTVGHSTTDILSTDSTQLVNSWVYDIDMFGPKDAFAGETAQLDIQPFNTTDINNCIKAAMGSGNPTATLAAVSFRSTDGSDIVVSP